MTATLVPLALLSVPGFAVSRGDIKGESGLAVLDTDTRISQLDKNHGARSGPAPRHRRDSG